MRIVLLCLWWIAWTAIWPFAATSAVSNPTAPTRIPANERFIHPGLLHGAADLERMKNQVALGAEPWKSGFQRLQEHRCSDVNWRIRGPFDKVVRDPSIGAHIAELEGDANAAYQNAIMWAITGQEAHARKVAEILNAWSGTLKEISGHDKELAASLCGFKLVNAAEIIRHTWNGWRAQDVAQFERLLRTVFYPVIQNFATFANGNWDTGCIKAMLAMGIYLEDRDLCDRALDYYRNGKGNGRLTHYIINVAGQCQESGRDQQHAQLGLAHLAETCELAWHQGVDLYGEMEDRLLRGFEYTARYNLGEEVPFEAFTDTTGKYKHRAISTQGRYRIRPIYEMVWNHFEQRQGKPAPYSRAAAVKIRPEGAAMSADHPGFGTLLFGLPGKAK